MTHITYYLTIQGGYTIFALLLFVAGAWGHPTREKFLRRAFKMGYIFHAIFLVTSLVYYYTGFRCGY